MNTGNNIPLSIPYLNGNEWQYLKNCLDSEWISTSGPFVDQFEEKIKKLTGVNFAVACINGTSALQLALKVSGVETNDEVQITVSGTEHRFMLKSASIDGTGLPSDSAPIYYVVSASSRADTVTNIVNKINSLL